MKKTVSSLMVASLILSGGTYQAFANEEADKTVLQGESKENQGYGSVEEIQKQDRILGTYENVDIKGKTWLSFISKSQDELTDDAHGQYVNVLNVYVEIDAEKTRGAKFYHYDKSLVKKAKEIPLREALEKNFEYAKSEKDEKARKLAEKNAKNQEPVNYSNTVRLGELGHLEDFVSVTGLPNKDTTYISLVLNKKTNEPLKINGKYIYGVQTVKAGLSGLVHFTVSDKLLPDNLLTASNVGAKVADLKNTKSSDLNTTAINKETSEWSILRTFVQDGLIVGQEIEEDPILFDTSALKDLESSEKEKTAKENKNEATGDDTKASKEESDSISPNQTEASVTLQKQETEVSDDSVPELAETGANNESHWYDFLLFWRYF